ncbi:MAG TPA: hypothetical protein VGR35_13010 [Tepidisphaeraceae bacterium]|nr:hypothetical protein [Tepidisphaeraceae bacterium]
MGADDKSAANDPLVAYGYLDEVYRLDPGPHLFIDWRYVYPGQVQYSMPDGTGVGHSSPQLTEEDIPRVRSQPHQVPFGVRLEAQPAESIGPVLKLDKPWEYLVAYANVIKVGDEYRMYYEALPTRNSEVPGNICLATSKDGLTWTKPELGIVEFEGSSANNIVFGAANTRYGLHGHQVFVDPLAPAKERFKLIYMGNKVKDRDPKLIERLKRDRPEAVHALAETKQIVMMGAASPDGLHWTEREQPLMAHVNDSGPSVYYDQKLKNYVGYFRHYVMGRRAISRSETDDFWNWPVPKLVLWPNATDEPSDDYYTNSHAIYPGTATMHLMFPVIYKRKSDGAAMRMGSSADGVNWQWIPGGNVLANGPIGSWNAGWFVGGVGLFQIPGERVALPCTGSPLPHKFPRVIPIGEIALAVWPSERLSAVVADQDGAFTTVSLAAAGDELFLNLVTPRTGAVQVQVEGVAGRTFEDCDPLFGDEMKKQVTWKGESSIGVKPGESFRLSIRMHNAKLFSFEVR